MGVFLPILFILHSRRANIMLPISQTTETKFLPCPHPISTEDIDEVRNPRMTSNTGSISTPATVRSFQANRNTTVDLTTNDTPEHAVAKKPRIKSHEAARSVVSRLLKNEILSYELKPFSSCRKNLGLKSKVYDSYQILLHANSFTPAGWLVCNYVHTGFCPLVKGLKEFKPEMGTTFLKQHTATHQSSLGKRSRETNEPMKCN